MFPEMIDKSSSGRVKFLLDCLKEAVYMKTIALADDMVDSLALVPGKDVEEKFSRLLENTFGPV